MWQDGPPKPSGGRRGGAYAPAAGVYTPSPVCTASPPSHPATQPTQPTLPTPPTVDDVLQQRLCQAGVGQAQLLGGAVGLVVLQERALALVNDLR